MNIPKAPSQHPIPSNATKVFDGVIFDIYQWEQKMFDGSLQTFEKAKRKVDSVNVLPINAEGKILLSKQTQPGGKEFVGAFGGRCEPNENPLDAAKRELMEETNLVAQYWSYLMGVQPQVKVEWTCYTFIAKDLTRVELTNPDLAGEQIEILEVTFDEYMDILKLDNYRDNEIALMFFKLQNKPVEMERVRSLFEVN